MSSDAVAVIDLDLLAEDEWSPVLATAGEGLSALSEQLQALQEQTAAVSEGLSSIAAPADQVAEAADTAAESLDTLATQADTVGTALASAGEGADTAATALGTVDEAATTTEESLAAVNESALTAAGGLDTVATAADAAGTAAAAAAGSTTALANANKEGEAAAAAHAASLSSASSALLLLGGGAAYAADKAIGLADNFQLAMLRVQDLAGVAPGDMQAVTQQVLDLSLQTGASATNVANGLYFVKSAGFDTASSMQILADTTKVATASQTDAATVANVTTSALRAYGQGADQTNSVLDTLIGTVTAGKMQFSDLTGSLGRVMDVAAQAGIGLDQVGASVAVMTQKGLSADEAVTALRGTILALDAPTGQTKTELANLGVSADEVRQSIRDKGLLATLDDLYAKTGGNVDQLKDLVPNVRALVGVLALASDGGASYAQVLKQVDSAQGDSAKLWGDYSNTASAAIGRLKASVEVGIIETFGAAASSIEPIVSRIADAAGAVDHFVQSNAPLRDAVGVLLALGAGAAGIAATAGAVGMIAAQLEKVWSFLGGAKAWDALTTAINGQATAASAAATDTEALAAADTALATAATEASGSEDGLAVAEGAQSGAGAISAGLGGTEAAVAAGGSMLGEEGAIAGAGALELAGVAADTTGVLLPLGIALGVAGGAVALLATQMDSGTKSSQAYKNALQSVNDEIDHLDKTQGPTAALDASNGIIDTATQKLNDTKAEIARVQAEMASDKAVASSGSQAAAAEGTTTGALWQQYDKDTQYLKTLEAEQTTEQGIIDQARGDQKALNEELNANAFKAWASDAADARDQAAAYDGYAVSATSATIALNSTLTAQITPAGIYTAENALQELIGKAQDAKVAVQDALNAASNDNTANNDAYLAAKTQYDAINNQINQLTALDNAKGIDASKDQEIIKLQHDAAVMYANTVLPLQQNTQATKEADDTITQILNDQAAGHITWQQAHDDISQVSGAHTDYRDKALAALDAQQQLNSTLQAMGGRAADVADGLSHAEHGVAMFGTASATAQGQVADATAGINTSVQSVATTADTASTDANTKLGSVGDTTPDLGSYTGSLITQATNAAVQARAAIEAQLQNIAAYAAVTVTTSVTPPTSYMPSGSAIPQSSSGLPSGPAPGVPGAGGGGSLSAGDFAFLANDNLDTLIGAGVGVGPNDLVMSVGPNGLVMGVDQKNPFGPTYVGSGPKSVPTAAKPAGPSHSGGGSHSGGSSAGSATSAAANAAVESVKQEVRDSIQALGDGLQEGLDSLDAIIHPDGKNALVQRLTGDLADPSNQASIADATSLIFNAAVSSGGADASASADTIINAWWSSVTKNVTDPAKIAELAAERDNLLSIFADVTPQLQQIAANDATLAATEARWTDLFDPNSITAERDKLVKGVEAGTNPMALLDMMFGTKDGQLTPEQAKQLPKIVDAARKEIENDPNLTPEEKAQASSNLVAYANTVNPTVSLQGDLQTAQSQATSGAGQTQNLVSGALSTKSSQNAVALGQAVGAALLAANYDDAQRLLESDPLEIEDVVKAAEDFILKSKATAQEKLAAMRTLAADQPIAQAAIAPNLANIDTSDKSNFDLGFQYGKSTGKTAPDYTNLERAAADAIENYGVTGDKAQFQKAVQLIASTGDDAEKVGNAVADLIKNDVATGVVVAQNALATQNALGPVGSAVGDVLYQQDQSKKKNGGYANANDQAIADYQNAQNTLGTDEGNLATLQASRNLITQELATSQPGSQDNALLTQALQNVNDQINHETDVIHTDLLNVQGLQQKANDAVDANLAAQQKQFDHMPGMGAAQQPPGVGQVPSPQAFAEAWNPGLDVYARGGAVGDTNFLAARQWITAAEKLNQALDKQTQQPVIHLHATSFMNGRIVGYIAGEAQGSDIELAQRGLPSSAAPTNVPTYSGSASGLYQAV